MSQEFINQHTVEHNGRHICKYFLEGRCIKVSLIQNYNTNTLIFVHASQSFIQIASQGDQCKFEHDNVVPEKKKELCKFYVQGYCTKGDICIYMHNILSEHLLEEFFTD